MFTHPLCLFYLKMWQMMKMTSLIRTGFSGLSLRNTSREGGGGGERAAGLKKGRFWVGTDTEEFVPDAAESVKAVWSRRTAPNASTALISPSLEARTPSASVACKFNKRCSEYLFNICILGLITLLLIFFFFNKYYNLHKHCQHLHQFILQFYVFTPFSMSSYRRCVRIEKGKMERIIKPFKGMSFKGHALSLTQSSFKNVLYKINHENVFLSPGEGLWGRCFKQWWRKLECWRGWRGFFIRVARNQKKVPEKYYSTLLQQPAQVWIWRRWRRPRE